MRVGDTIVMLADASTAASAAGRCRRPWTPTSRIATGLRRALEAGATTLREPADTFYGDRSAGVVDPLGNHWWIHAHRGRIRGRDDAARSVEQGSSTVPGSRSASSSTSTVVGPGGVEIGEDRIQAVRPFLAVADHRRPEVVVPTSGGMRSAASNRKVGGEGGTQEPRLAPPRLVVRADIEPVVRPRPASARRNHSCPEPVSP